MKKILAITLIGILMLTISGSSLAETDGDISLATSLGEAVIKEKDEVIYARFSATGQVESIYAVNHFELEKSGSFTDQGNYTSVINLTDTNPLTLTENKVNAVTSAENFYYQGYLTDTYLPWNFHVEYFLDGSSIEPQELADKSGNLSIKINTSKNENINPVFYENYMLQISLTLDLEKCSDISAPGATLANSGKSKVVAYTVMPGNDADISLKASVKNFEMAGIDITAMPFSMSFDIPDTDDMIGDFTQLTDAISELNDGVGKLADGAAEMKEGSVKLKDGSAEFKDGLVQLGGNSSQLTNASKQIMDALTQISSELSGNSVSGFSDLAQLPEGLSQLAMGLDQVSGGITQLKNGYAQAYEALDKVISEIPDNIISQDQIQELYAKTDPGQYDLLDKLIASYTASMTVKGAYSQVKAAFEAMVPTMDTLESSISAISASVKDMSSQIGTAMEGMDLTAQMKQLSDGLSQLSKNYSSFHNGLTAYMKGTNELANGYAELDTGVSSLSDGISQLYDGITGLYDGTKQMAEETADMPDIFRKEIDNMISQYTGGDFEPVSFVSENNKDTIFVQFVFKAAEIKILETEKTVIAETKQENFWDRLVKLFAKK